MRNNVIGIVFKKELLDMFRDKKTLIFSLLLPLIMLPLISFIIGKTTNDSANKVQSNIKISIIDNGNSKLGQYIKAQKNINIINSSDIKRDINDGKIMLAINIPKQLDESIGSEEQAKITMTYDNSSSDATMAVSIVKSYIDQYTKGIVTTRLKARNINQEILTPINVVEDTVEKGDSGIGKMVVMTMVPLLLILYSFAGTMAPATDLGAGEKERGTLEPLLTTRANRMSLLWGKFFAITVMGVTISVASIIGLIITINEKNGIFSTAGKTSLNLSVLSIALIMLLPILCTMVFGAVELAISIYAKSFKEAQTYNSPVMIVGMILTYLTMAKDPKNIENYYFSIPVTNATCVIKELLAGIHNYNHIVITFGWMIVYVVGALLFARYMFSREDVVFRA